jgi:hypothetical protein
MAGEEQVISKAAAALFSMINEQVAAQLAKVNMYACLPDMPPWHHKTDHAVRTLVAARLRLELHAPAKNQQPLTMASHASKPETTSG